jgi:CarD family transcriptional regulator
LTPSDRFRSGAAVVHPHHGAGVVVGRQRRGLRGESREYLVIRIEHAQLRVLVPEDAVDRVGLRPVMEGQVLSDVLHVLEERPHPMLQPWSARSKDYRARLADGDVLSVAGLVRDLEGRCSDRNGLSAMERSLLQSCRRRLVSELALALALTPGDAEAHLDSLVGRDPAA